MTAPCLIWSFIHSRAVDQSTPCCPMLFDATSSARSGLSDGAAEYQADFSFHLPIPPSVNIISVLLSSFRFPRSGNLASIKLSAPVSITHLSHHRLTTQSSSLCVTGVHITTWASALTVALLLVIHKGFSLIISVIGIVHVWHTIHDFVPLTSARICSVLGLDAPILWNFLH